MSNLVLFLLTLLLNSTNSFRWSNRWWRWWRPRPTPRPGLFGKFPVFSGNAQSQHRTPDLYSYRLNKYNIRRVSRKCTYQSVGGRTFSGYITVDLNDNGYFADLSGNIISIKLEDCSLNWNISISQALIQLGFNETIIGNINYISKNSPAIFRDKFGNKALLIGAPNERPTNMNSFTPCFALAINLKGEPLWAIDVSTPTNNPNINEVSNKTQNLRCVIHAWNIRGNYGYAGMSSLGVTNPIQEFRGRVIQIDLNERIIKNVWFAIPERNFTNVNDSGYYSGAPMWVMPSIIGRKVVIGTGQLYTVPQSIMQCLKGEVDPSTIEMADNDNFCGEPQQSLKYQCFENDVYSNSLVVLANRDLDFEYAKRTTGIDLYDFNSCYNPALLPFGQFDPIPPDQAPITCGLDADFTAVGVYQTRNKEAYSIGQSKMGQLYITNLRDGSVKFSKKYGVWSRWGGNSYGVAISPKYNIVLARFTGQNGPQGPFIPPGVPFIFKLWNQQIFTLKLSNNMITCATGVIYAVDLRTGKTLYEIANPFGLFSLEECRQKFNTTSRRLYFENEDPSNDGVCTKNTLNRRWWNYRGRSRRLGGSSSGSSSSSSSDSSENGNQNRNRIPVIIPPAINPDSNPPLLNKTDLEFSYLRGGFYGPPSIYNNLIFIPSMSGDVFVHNLLNGRYLKTFSCDGEWTSDLFGNRFIRRPAIASGVTVVDDRVIFYCGFYTDQRAFEYNGEGGYVVSYKL